MIAWLSRFAAGRGPVPATAAGLASEAIPDAVQHGGPVSGALHRALDEARQETAELRQRLDRMEQRVAPEDAARTRT